MAKEEKAVAEKKPVAEYIQEPPVGPYDNNVDYVYGFTAVKAEAGVSKGIKHSVVVPGIPEALMSALLKSKAGQAVEEFIDSKYKGGGGLKGLVLAALQQRGTRPQYTKGGTPEESQATFDTYDWSGTRKQGEAAKVKAKAAEMDQLEKDLASAATDEEALAIIKRIRERNAG